ncbi:hypothetical protein MHY29_02410 [Micrococcus sp. ACRRV]|uniref:hypothetical protein n=1 Tax=Micrococcus sp. ACRRV TaxID=2918203 RepID=UPI001EF2E043|nr:hypothetical protein [Micrococcus sp. ACRRV]
MTALTLLALGLRDLLAVTPGRTSRHPWLALLAAVGAVLIGGVVLAGGAASAAETLSAVALALGAVLAWHALARAGSPHLRVGALGGVVGLAVAEHTGALTVAHGPVGMALLGAGLVLVETANVVTRDVLRLAGRPSTDDVHDADDDGEGLRGGRFIGPMERLLMAVLGLMAAWQVVAAIMAAKGIVRFPEISKDARAGDAKGGPMGASAEEFLVGSLASWTLAAGAGLVVHLALAGG